MVELTLFKMVLKAQGRFEAVANPALHQCAPYCRTRTCDCAAPLSELPAGGREGRVGVSPASGTTRSAPWGYLHKVLEIQWLQPSSCECSRTTTRLRCARREMDAQGECWCRRQWRPLRRRPLLRASGDHRTHVYRCRGGQTLGRKMKGRL